MNLEKVFFLQNMLIVGMLFIFFWLLGYEFFDKFQPDNKFGVKPIRAFPKFTRIISIIYLLYTLAVIILTISVNSWSHKFMLWWSWGIFFFVVLTVGLYQKRESPYYSNYLKLIIILWVHVLLFAFFVLR